MSDMTDGAGIGDAVGVDVNGDWVGEALAPQLVGDAGSDGQPVKGPDPAVWGEEHAATDPRAAALDTPGAQLVGGVGDDGEPVKGPDPSQHPRDD